MADESIDVKAIAREKLFDSIREELPPPDVKAKSSINMQIDLKSVTIALAACAQLIGRTPRNMSPADIACIADNAKLLGAELFNPKTKLGGE